MSKKEADFGAQFAAWYMKPENKFWANAVFEYKVTAGGTYNLNTWRKKQGHQEVNLAKANDKRGIFHTFTDLDPRGTPYDASFMSEVPSFLVIMFLKHGKFFMLPVHEIPYQTSVSYWYCMDKWGSYEFPPKKRKKYVI